LFPKSCKSQKHTTKYNYRSTNSVDGNIFRNDLETTLTPIATEVMNTNISRQNFDNYFNKLVTAISQVVETHAPLQTASRKEKRILQKPWLTKALLTSIKNKQKLHRACF